MSEFPRMVYHSDGRTALAASAHERAHLYGDWGDTPEAIHRAHPDGGRFVARGMVENPLIGNLPADPPGPVDAGTMRKLIREELSMHPGMDGGIIAPMLESIIRAELAPLMARLGVEVPHLGTVMPAELPPTENPDPIEPEEPGDFADEPRKRRGRPPGSTNRLTELQE
jgi:hypothetical protein